MQADTPLGKRQRMRARQAATMAKGMGAAWVGLGVGECTEEEEAEEEEEEEEEEEDPPS